MINNHLFLITLLLFFLSDRGLAIDFHNTDSIDGPPTAPAGKYYSMNDLADKRIGIFIGTVLDPFLQRNYPKAQVFRYNGTADMVLSLKAGKIDAIMLKNVVANIILKHNPDLVILEDDIYTLPLGIGFNKNTPALQEEFNLFLKKIREDGTYDSICNRWLINDAENALMPPFPNSKSGKKLIAGIVVDDLPYIGFKNGEYIGFDIEILERFAQAGNYNLEFFATQHNALLAALLAGKADMITDGLCITDERKKQIDFSDPYTDIKTVVIITKKNLAGFHDKGKTSESGRYTILKSITNSFRSNILTEKRYLLIIDGLKVTLIISILAALLGTIIGGIICYMRMSSTKILPYIAAVIITLIRGTPVLVLLMIIFYVVFASVNISPPLVAVIAFSLNFGAYVSEMFRSAIQSIDKGQWEAGIAGGFTKPQTFIYIIMPQALLRVLPVYKGEFISLVKMTSVVGYIAVQDLTKASDIIRSSTYDAFFPLIMAAVIYLVIAWFLTWLLGRLEVSVDPKRRVLIKMGGKAR
jgi:polar amino acid transport system substrate-binding protein